MGGWEELVVGRVRRDGVQQSAVQRPLLFPSIVSAAMPIGWGDLQLGGTRTQAQYPALFHPLTCLPPSCAACCSRPAGRAQRRVDLLGAGGAGAGPGVPARAPLTLPGGLPAGPGCPTGGGEATQGQGGCGWVLGAGWGTGSQCGRDHGRAGRCMQLGRAAALAGQRGAAVQGGVRCSC